MKLIHLNKKINELDTLQAWREIKIYNPAEERKKINNEFKKLINSAKNNSASSYESIEQLQQIVADLLTFYEQQIN
ncbi:hypothetical protein EDM52_23985 [Brevibacillus invocatus]|uniref:Uncharacterized protein n=1 Tax=Brevibacillus invocatus TaxID=173959 RepID=A0A3M8BPV6_9BACL|nr:hypothetical protein [Brevibacillus invocatus]RNB64885.1 hypothetical protein EDM52_23985 [Brevibacillus invocatus]